MTSDMTDILQACAFFCVFACTQAHFSSHFEGSVKHTKKKKKKGSYVENIIQADGQLYRLNTARHMIITI